MISIKSEEFTKSLLNQIGISPIPKIVRVETTTTYFEIADADYGYLNSVYVVSRLSESLSNLKIMKVGPGGMKRSIPILPGMILVQEQHFPQLITVHCRPDELSLLPQANESEIESLSLEDKIILSVTAGYKSAYRYSEVINTQRFYRKPQWTKEHYDEVVKNAQVTGILAKNKSITTKYRLIYNNNSSEFGLNSLIKSL